jgi:hypothetical protein
MRELFDVAKAATALLKAIHKDLAGNTQAIT